MLMQEMLELQETQLVRAFDYLLLFISSYVITTKEFFIEYKPITEKQILSVAFASFAISCLSREEILIEKKPFISGYIHLRVCLMMLLFTSS